MSLYSRFILPRFINLAMQNPGIMERRAHLISRAKGRVLEIGIGSGLNFQFYGREVEDVVGVDPSPELLAKARRRIAGLPFPVKLICKSAEALPFEKDCFDTIVITWTLCTIPNPDQALKEMRRVLKPMGQLLFVEHGLASRPELRTWQVRVNPIWKRIAGGCNLNREIDRLLVDAGFDLLELEKSYLPGPRIMTYTFQGVAV